MSVFEKSLVRGVVLTNALTRIIKIFFQLFYCNHAHRASKKKWGAFPCRQNFSTIYGTCLTNANSRSGANFEPPKLKIAPLSKFAANINIPICSKHVWQSKF